MFFADPPSRCHTLSRAGTRSDPSRRAPLRCRRRRRHTRARRIFPRTARTTAEAQAHRARRPQFQDDRLRRLHRARNCGRHRQEQFTGGAGGARACIDRGVPPQRGARSRTHEARRMAVHAVASAARIDAGHLWRGRHRAVGRAGGSRARNGCAGLGPKILLGESRRRRIRECRKQAGAVRTFRRVVAACASRSRHLRHRGFRRSRSDEADGLDREHVAGRAHRAGSLAGRVAQGPTGLRRGRCLRARAGHQRKSSVLVHAERSLHAPSGLGRMDELRTFLEAFEQIVAYQQGLPLRLANPEVQPRS